MKTPPPLRTIEVCAGIGGITLGFELAGGFEPVAFVERDDYARSILKRHWPAVPQYRDLRSVSAWNLPAAEVLAGGIPCQPHSFAGQRKAGADERDLWGEFYRLICEIRPRYAVVENVPGLRSSDGGRFFGNILGDLAAGGYVVEWIGLSAAEVGAPHKRDRVWIVAYPQGLQLRPEPSTGPDSAGYSGAWTLPGQAEVLAHADVGRLRAGERDPRPGEYDIAWSGPILANPERQSLALGQSVGRGIQPQQPAAERGGLAGIFPDALGEQCDGAGRLGESGRWPELTDGHWWAVEPDVGRVAYGIPHRVDRLRCLGNAVVPRCARLVGRYIQAHYRRYA